MLRQLICSLLVVGIGYGTTVLSQAAGSPLGKKIDGFSLHDFRGKVHKLSDYTESKVTVVAFIGVGCPLAKLYASRLEQLATEYGERGVTLVAIDSNRQDTITDLAGYAQRHKLSFPVLKDPDNAVADLFGAKRTPEVFLLDADGVVQYHGRIDDQYGQHFADNNQRISYQHTRPDRRDLAIAIDEVLAGDAISIASTTVTGCLIGRVPKVEPTGDVTYSNQIVRILNKRCVQCHREGEIAPFALTQYEEVAGWSDMISEVVAEQRMPPWYANPKYGKFENDCRLSEEEMMIGFFATRELDPIDHEALKAEKEAAEKKLAQMKILAKAFIASIDEDNSGTLSKDEAPEQMRRFFKRVDSNKDGQIDIDEAVEVVRLQRRRR